jgi:hypothetical protein
MFADLKVEVKANHSCPFSPTSSRTSKSRHADRLGRRRPQIRRGLQRQGELHLFGRRQRGGAPGPGAVHEPRLPPLGCLLGPGDEGGIQPRVPGNLAARARRIRLRSHDRGRRHDEPPEGRRRLAAKAEDASEAAEPGEAVQAPGSAGPPPAAPAPASAAPASSAAASRRCRSASTP